MFQISSKLLNLTKILSNNILNQRVQSLVRYSSYISSPPVRPLEEYPDVEIIKSPPEWKYVEKLLGPSTVPKPIPKIEYSTVWKPSNIDPTNVNSDYYISRTKNYMLPVYLRRTHRGLRRITMVRKVEGDIWKLEKELRIVVEKGRGKICAVRVNEMSGQIHFNGDCVNLIKEYLMGKGF